MSDASGPGISTDGRGYVTGYPLQESGVYALAQTWPAPEMPRPGCVWTHTIFIPFAELARIETPSTLSQHFAKPPETQQSAYAVPLTVELPDAAVPWKFTPSDQEWITRVVTALYGSASNRIVARADAGASGASLVMRVWDQQWPRLRRSFRFCTLTTKDRSVDGAIFDLQLVPDTSGRVRFPNSVDALEVTAVPIPAWVEPLVEDLEIPNRNGLRDTLRAIGVEILGGRDAMAPLCEFHRLTERSDSPSGVAEAIDFIGGAGPLSTSTIARAKVAQVALGAVDSIQDGSIRFLWDNRSLLDETKLRQAYESLGRRLWRYSPTSLIEAANKDDTSEVAREVIRAVPLDVIFDQGTDLQYHIGTLLKLRSDFLTDRRFWSSYQLPSSARSSVDLGVDSVVEAMILGTQSDEAIRSNLSVVGAGAILRGINRLSWLDLSVANVDRWIAISVADRLAVADFLSNALQPAENLIVAIARKLQPDDVPNAYGDDPWLHAFDRIRDSKGSLPLYLASYGFARALGNRSRSVAELMVLTFEQLHKAASYSSFDVDSWSLLDRRLAWVPSEYAWDLAKRLRKSVAKSFVESNLWPRDFAWISSFNEVFVALMDEVNDRRGGMKFLRAVEASLAGESNSFQIGRRELIHSYIESHRRRWT